MKDQVVQTNWKTMTVGDRMHHLEVEGYVVIPQVLSSNDVTRLRTQLRTVKTVGADYTEKKWVHNDIQWAGGDLTELMANPPVVRFLSRLFGASPIVMTYDYSRSESGCPAINLHADGQPWGTKIFGPEQSCPKLVRALYYLQDLTPERAPFRVVPRSHLSFHNEANLYLRYRSHPEQVMVTCSAGDACLINQNVFHGNYPNRSNESREMLGIAYRPTWAGPCEQVDPWPDKEMGKVSPAVRAVLGDRNARIWNYDAANVPDSLAENAPGIAPSRWDLVD